MRPNDLLFPPFRSAVWELRGDHTSVSERQESFRSAREEERESVTHHDCGVLLLGSEGRVAPNLLDGSFHLVGHDWGGFSQGSLV